MDANEIGHRIALLFNPMPDMSGNNLNRLHGEQRRRVEQLAADIVADNDRVREAAENIYHSMSCGEPTDKEFRELGRALGMLTDG